MTKFILLLLAFTLNFSTAVLAGPSRGEVASKRTCGTDKILSGKEERGSSSNEDDEGTVRSGAWLLNLMIPKATAASGYTIDQRIKNCSSLPGAVKTTASGVQWNLVARSRDPDTGKFYEVWKDCGKDKVCNPEGLLWGDALDSHYSPRLAVDEDDKGKVSKETACISQEGSRANAGITEKSFGLPTKKEFKQAVKDGVLEVVPNMKDRWFLTKTIRPDSSQDVFVFYPSSGVFNYGNREDDIDGVRCVGR